MTKRVYFHTVMPQSQRKAGHKQINETRVSKETKTTIVLMKLVQWNNVLYYNTVSLHSSKCLRSMKATV